MKNWRFLVIHEQVVNCSSVHKCLSMITIIARPKAGSQYDTRSCVALISWNANLNILAIFNDPTQECNAKERIVNRAIHKTSLGADFMHMYMPYCFLWITQDGPKFSVFISHAYCSHLAMPCTTCISTETPELSRAHTLHCIPSCIYLIEMSAAAASVCLLTTFTTYCASMIRKYMACNG